MKSELLSYCWGFIDGVHYTKDMHANYEREHNVGVKKACLV